MSLSENDTWQERAAILQHDAGYTEGLAQAVAVVFCINTPPEINPKDWQLMTDLLGKAADDYSHMERMTNQ